MPESKLGWVNVRLLEDTGKFLSINWVSITKKNSREQCGAIFEKRGLAKKYQTMKGKEGRGPVDDIPISHSAEV